MRAILVVAMPPIFCQVPRLRERVTQVQVEDSFAIGAVETLDTGILRRLPRLNKVQQYVMFLLPLHQGGGEQFRSLVDAKALWIATPLGNPLQHALHPLAGQGRNRPQSPAARGRRRR